MTEIKIVTETLGAALPIIYLDHNDKQVLAIDGNGSNIIELEVFSKNSVYVPEFSLDSEFKIERPKYEINKFNMNRQIIQRCEALVSTYMKINPDIVPAISILIRSDSIFACKDKNTFGSNLKLAMMITEDQNLDMPAQHYYGLCCYVPDRLFV